MNKYCTIGIFLVTLSTIPTSSLAQYAWQEGADTVKQNLGDGVNAIPSLANT